MQVGGHNGVEVEKVVHYSFAGEILQEFCRWEFGILGQFASVWEGKEGVRKKYGDGCFLLLFYNLTKSDKRVARWARLFILKFCGNLSTWTGIQNNGNTVGVDGEIGLMGQMGPIKLLLRDKELQTLHLSVYQTSYNSKNCGACGMPRSSWLMGGKITLPSYLWSRRLGIVRFGVTLWRY